MKYSGILQPLLNSAKAKLPGRIGKLVGQRVVVANRDLHSYICFDSDGNLHFLLEPPAGSLLQQLQEFQLRSLVIGNNVWAIGEESARDFLDICCLAGNWPSLERPFLSFCEDILLDLEEGGSAEEAVLRTCKRWDLFWAEEDATGFSQEWLRGLLGEVVFLRTVLRYVGPSAVKAWTGPERLDHDFQGGTEVAFEVKTSASMPFIVHCNLEQLDAGIFGQLFLVCFLVQPFEEGISIVDVVREVEAALGSDENHLATFLRSLKEAGYRRHLESELAAHRFKVSEAQFFVVDGAFPKITLRSFSPSLDARIKDVRYQLELAGLSPLTLEDGALVSSLMKLGSAV